MATANTFRQRVVGWLGSQRFFWLVVGLLVVQAIWIALSGRYPMAFDENFHLGIIRLYASHLSPFWAGQPAGADAYGAVARDPSYLYQWLMSFPYRLVCLFTNDQTIQVLGLRFINIGLFAASLGLYRRLLLKTGASRAVAQAALLVFVLVPVTPLLAAQINYDNLLLPLVALAFLMVVNFDRQLPRRLDAKLLLQLLIICLLTSLVQFEFLPLFAAFVVFVAVRLWQGYHSLGKIWQELASGCRHLGRRTQTGLLIGLVVAGGLFVQRYGVNLVLYHEPVPDCSQVLSVGQCSQYGPWARDYNLQLAHLSGPRDPLTFTADWLYGMWLRTFFAVDGPGTNFETRGPFVLPGIGAIVFAVAGLVAVIVMSKRLLQRYRAPVLWLFVGSAAVYLAALWLDEYKAFVLTGQAVAINGRYLLPVLPMLLVIMLAAVNELFRRRSYLKLASAAIVVVCLAWGGGALTYILRSDDAWYWPNPAVRDVNHAVQKVVGPLVPGDKQPEQFVH